jgi:hypothetical protein
MFMYIVILGEKRFIFSRYSRESAVENLLSRESTGGRSIIFQRKNS